MVGNEEGRVSDQGGLSKERNTVHATCTLYMLSYLYNVHVHVHLHKHVHMYIVYACTYVLTLVMFTHT